MTFTVNLSARAEADVGAILDGIVEQAPGAAAPWHARLTAAIESLAFMPTRWPLSAETATLGFDLRETIFGKHRGTFRILFTVEGTVVNVLHVRRATRGPIQPDDLV